MNSTYNFHTKIIKKYSSFDLLTTQAKTQTQYTTNTQLLSDSNEKLTFG